MNNYQNFLKRAKIEHGDKFDPSDLNQWFVPYFGNQLRIEVDLGNGVVKRGRIGVTTGCKPVFLLMLTTRSIGSEWTIGRGAKVLRVVAP